MNVLFLRLISIFAAALVAVTSLSINAFADITDDARAVSGNIVTEYYSDDLTDDIESVAAIPMSSPPEINAKSVILMEQSTGKVLYENNADEQLPPASITKIMTMVLICEALDSGALKMTDVVTTSEHAASMGGSQIWLEPKETMNVKDLIKAVAIGSANDASVALAEHIAGSEEGFVTMMNEKAKQLGMKNTVFKNACGLDADGHLSTARDVALMSRELLKHDVIREFTSTWMDSLRGGETQLVNTNKLVRFYLGATGLKTGTTDKAGSCLSASAKRDNMELIAVVMGATDSKERFAGAKKLLDYGFANWKITTPTVDKSSISTLHVKLGQKESVKLSFDEINPELIRNGEKSAIKSVVELPESMQAPIVKGEQIGKLKIMNGDKLLSEYAVYAAEDVERVNFGYTFSRLISKLFAA
ncbi:MAG: D-alanyl-D-alanine carboxypeptidase family protein [Acutalibacteraceae bacterium]